MPKKIDPKVEGGAFALLLEHPGEYSSLTAAAEVVARREGLGKEAVRHWVRTTVLDNGPYRSVHDVEYATAGWVDCYNRGSCPQPVSI